MLLPVENLSSRALHLQDLLAIVPSPPLSSWHLNAQMASVNVSMHIPPEHGHMQIIRFYTQDVWVQILVQALSGGVTLDLDRSMNFPVP